MLAAPQRDQAQRARQRGLQRLAGPRAGVDELLGRERAHPAHRCDHRGREGEAVVRRPECRVPMPMHLGCSYRRRWPETFHDLGQRREEVRAALFTVGDHVEPNVLVQPQRLVGSPVLDQLEVSDRDLTRSPLGTSSLEPLRTEQRADILGSVDCVVGHAKRPPQIEMRPRPSQIVPQIVNKNGAHLAWWHRVCGGHREQIVWIGEPCG